MYTKTHPKIIISKWPLIVRGQHMYYYLGGGLYRYYVGAFLMGFKNLSLGMTVSDWARVPGLGWKPGFFSIWTGRVFQPQNPGTVSLTVFQLSNVIKIALISALAKYITRSS